MDEKAADENLVELFQQWLTAFEAAQAACARKRPSPSAKVLVDVESRIAATPAEGLRGFLVQLGLHQFLKDSADAASIKVGSAYRDLIGHDPASEISSRFRAEEAE